MFQELLVAMLRNRTSLRDIRAAGSAAAAMAEVKQRIPDLLILDIALGDGDGLQVARALQQVNANARILVLSSYASTFQRPADLRSAIVAVIDKSRAFDELVQELNHLHGPDQPTSTAATTVEEEPDALRGLVLRELTRRERQVLVRIGQGYSNRAMADELALSVRTVESHRRNIAIKLGCSGARLIRIATLLNEQLV